MIAAILLWLVTFSVSICFVLPTVRAAAENNITIDFERQDARDRAKIAAARKKKKVASAPRDTTTSTPQQLQQSYSFDSQQSWTRKVPKRSTADGTATSQVALEQKQQRDSRKQQQQQAVQQYPAREAAGDTLNRRTASTAQVDDVVVSGNTHKMEVYIADRLNRIEKIAEV